MALADEILAAVPSNVRRPTWWDKLPKEASAELLDVRRRFHAGEYGELTRYRLGTLLLQRCQSRGWRTCDARRMAEWLAQTND